MLLRSSSTPILGSLLSSSSSLCFSESPNHHHHHHHHSAGAIHYSSFAAAAAGHLSPVSDHSDHSSSSLGFRRTLSEDSLRSLLPDPSDHHQQPMACRRNNPVLETIPSFAIYCTKEQEQEAEEPDQLHRSITIGDGIAGENDYVSQDTSAIGLAAKSRGVEAGSGGSMPPLFLARGLGIDRIGSGLLAACGDGGACGGGGGGGSGKCKVLTGSGGDQSDVELYYKKMVEEDPSNALFLRNYAEFLYQSKGDPKRAEEYYSRAILVDPSDGEILSQYAKLIWELHRDEERASSYFEQAVQATPHDSHVLAAYAGFLWETEDTDGDVGAQGGSSQDFFVDSAHNGTLASATA